MKRLYIGGLSHLVTQKDLKDRFGKFGDVEDVELRTRRDDEGVPHKTFGYININISDADLKKCMTVLNKSKWKGGTLQIETAKESFLHRLAEERQTAAEQRLQQPAAEDKRQKMLDSLSKAGVDDFTMKAAVPGTEVPGHKDWVVSKFGRVLPVLQLRCQKGSRARTLKYDPSKYSHNIRKLDRSTGPPEQPTPVDQLTWEVRGGDDDISKKRRGEFPPYEPPRRKKTRTDAVDSRKADVGSRFKQASDSVHHADAHPFTNGNKPPANHKPAQRSGPRLAGGEIDSDEEICRMVASQSSSHDALQLDEEEDKLEVVGLDYLVKSGLARQQRRGGPDDEEEDDYDSADTDELFASRKAPPPAQERLTPPTSGQLSGNDAGGKRTTKKKSKAAEEEYDSSDAEEGVNSGKSSSQNTSKKMKVLPVVKPSSSESDDEDEDDEDEDEDEDEEEMESADDSSDLDYEAMFSNVTHLEISLADLQKLAEESEQADETTAPSMPGASSGQETSRPAHRKGTLPEEILAALMEDSSEDEQKKKKQKKKKRKAVVSTPLPAFQGTRVLNGGPREEEEEEEEEEGGSEVKKQKLDSGAPQLNHREVESKISQKKSTESSEDEEEEEKESETGSSEDEEEGEEEKEMEVVKNTAKKAETPSSSGSDDEEEEEEEEEKEEKKGKVVKNKAEKAKTSSSSGSEEEVEEEKMKASVTATAAASSSSSSGSSAEEDEQENTVKAAPTAAPHPESSSSSEEEEEEEKPAPPRVPLGAKEEEERQRKANTRRLAAVQQRQKEAEENKKLIQGALANLDTPTGGGAGKHIVFGSDDDDDDDDDELQATPKVTTPKKTLFQDSQSEDEATGDAVAENNARKEKVRLKPSGPQLFGDGEDEEQEDVDEEEDGRFDIRPQFEGRAGQKLMALQSRFGTDERFRMDSRFLEEVEDKGEESEKKKKSVTEEEEPLEEERKKNLSILQDVLGSGGQQTGSGKPAAKTKTFRDVAALHYDPSKEEHAAFETKTDETKKESKSARRKKREEAEKLPEVSKEIYYDVSVDLKAVFGQTKEDDAAVEEEKTNWDQEEKEKEEEEGGKDEQPTLQSSLLSADPSAEKDDTSGFKFSFFGDDAETGSGETEYKVESIQAPKVSWQQDLRFQDSSSDEEEQEKEEEEEQSNVAAETTQEETPSKAELFFFQPGDSRLTEGPRLFCRPSQLEEQREQWEERRSELRQEYRKKHKDARRKLKSSMKS